MPVQRRDFFRLTGMGLCLSALGRPERLWSAAEDPPNIVICLADDQGWGDMGYYGHPALKTPNLDEMAASCLRFDRFYAAAPVCSPTRGSILTGRHPNRYGCFSWGRTLRPQEVTLAEALRTAGYVTGHFGKWHLGSVRRGSPVNPGASGFDEWLSAENFFDNDPLLSREGVAEAVPGESSAITVDAALDFIRRHAGGERPFLALVWFGSPHDPHRASETDRNLYMDQPEKLRDYYGEISGIDRAFGRLRTALGELGLRDSTLLWYLSDNGGLPGLGVTGGRGNKAQIYEGGLRVPGLLEWPSRIRSPRITGVPCNTCDLYPTLLELAGVSLDRQPPLDGVSLTGLIDGAMTSRPRPMGFWQHAEGGISMNSENWMRELQQAQRSGDMLGDMSRLRLDAGAIDKQYPENSFPGHAAWLDWPWKLHRIQDENGTARFELYNLESDPRESADCLKKETGRTLKMRTELEAWLGSVVRSLNGKDYV